MEGGQAVASASLSSEDVHHVKAQEFKQSGNDKFNNNNYKGAIFDYKKGLLHEPNNPDLHANLSAAYIHLEKYLDAEEHAVYTIQLRPEFYKGYMRAAKAAHGKGMTTLALKRLSKGLTHVTDPNGVRELNRLRNQYTAYLSLKCNAEREMDFSSDKYLSEEEDEPYSEDEEDLEHEFANLVCSHGSLLQEKCAQCAGLSLMKALKSANRCSEETKFADKSADLAAETSKLFANIPESSSKAVPVQATVRKNDVQKSEPHFSCALGASSKEENEESVTNVSTTAQQNCAESDVSLNKRDNSQEKQPDRFLEMCKELTKDPELNKHVEEFKEHLKTGSEAFLSGNFRKAVECYKAAKERVGIKITDYEIDDRQYHVIKYVYCAALINLDSYEDVVKAIQTLLEMRTYEFSIPALYVQLARAYCKLNRFKTALEPLGKLQEILDNYPIFPTFTWPGTTETIQETTPTGLKDAVKELNQTCRMSHKPTAVCRYDHCLKTTTHILPSELIYISDPDFTGFVRMVCEEKCHIEFHIACWKSYKESISGISKMNDKDFLGQRCLTTDCVSSEGTPSLITVIEIIDADGQVKSVNKLDPKTTVDSKKSKKKKCKLDDKEKVVKPKKPKEKKVREVKKPTVVVEEDDELVESVRNCTDSANILQARIQSLKELRDLNFGVEKSWDPKTPFYGRSDEMEKWLDKCETESSNVQYVDYSNDESIDVKDAKEFIFSYFMEILKAEEKPLKQTYVEELWKQVAEDFCNIRVVLPNLKSMCELLLESTCFCQLEDYICLAGQLDTAYATVKTEVEETVMFLMIGSTDRTSSRATQSKLPDLLHHPQAVTSTNELVSQISSEDDSAESQDEYLSGPDSEESEEETSEEEEENIETPPVKVFETQKESDTQEFTAPEIKPLDDEKFSLQNMLDEMSRVKNMFMKATLDESAAISEMDFQTNQGVIESPHNDTFETAHESLQNFSDDDKNISDSSDDEHENCTVDADIVSEMEINSGTVVSQVLDQVGSTDGVIENEKNNIISLNDTENVVPADGQVLTSDAECDKASQIGVFTEERQIQTTAVETRDTLSQTKDSDVYKELNQKMQELTKQVNDLSKENTRLAKEVIDKENLNKEVKKAQDKTIASLQDKHNKAISTLKDQNKKMREDISKKEAELKESKEKMMNEMKNMQESYVNLALDKQKFMKEVNSLLEEKQELEVSRVALENNLKTKILQSQQAQLLITKAFWENQVNLLVKRCVEKISEMHSWFSLLPSGEVEELPSWKEVRQTTMQWGEIRNKLQQIQAEFQMKYTVFENKLWRGEEVDDLCSLTLPTLPNEPNPLPLDKIHKEITDKYTKRISELTQLVANQQLEIEKSKDNSQQFQNLMSSYQMAPRMQNPITTAFGSLALQYSYPATLPSQFGSTSIPTIPPNQDMSKIGNMTKPLQADVQTLLQESSTAKFNTSENASIKGIGVGNMFPLSTSSAIPSSFLSVPPPTMGLPPPLMGVAQSLLKSTSALGEKKDKKPVEQQTHTKPEAAKTGSSRESTPVPGSTPVPTPEKTRKKKKSKADIRDVGEAKPPTPVSAAAFASEDVDTTPWCVAVSKKNLPKPVSVAVAPTSDSKWKNKKRLLDKLQLKFPTTPLKDLDEIVKLVREQNNGYLSGLPFEEIETRVERLITKRHYQKSTTMGLVKFSNAAWGPVKQQETVTWVNLQLEECTICLEPMGNDRTKVDCNHEFHTKCLRKWLKEKSVCPLCNNFTTMPDEFPAL